MIRPTRVVDAHVHLWDPARTDWYPYLAGAMELDMGDTSGMNRRFDASIHAAESAGWNVTGLVHVAAAVGEHSIDETLALDAAARSADGPPLVAVVGGITERDTPAETIGQLERQSAASRFRGVRPMGQPASPVPHVEVLRALAERDLVFDLMARPHQLEEAARALAEVPGLTVVVEHAGWPRADTDDEHRLWRRGIDRLAALGDRVSCKISGLAMPLGTTEPGPFRRWVGGALEVFGPDRCFFASNFPVDGMHGTLDELLTTYADLATELAPDHVDALFATNAERIYSIDPT